MSVRADRYWSQFLATLPAGASPPRFVEAFSFGWKPEHADEINPLVLDGTKTATGSLLWAIEADGKPTPSAGDHWIVESGRGEPVCVLRTTDVRVMPFEDVGVDYAVWGGEGDRTLESWREMYWRYITLECERIGWSPDRRAPLVMERFEVVYAEPPRRGPEASVGS